MARGRWGVGVNQVVSWCGVGRATDDPLAIEQ
jgi:hypothetical protein